MVPTKLQVICLMSSYYIKFKCSVDIIFLPNVCEAYTNTCYLPARNSLSKAVESRKIDSRFTNFTLEYKDIYDFALIRGLQIPNHTTDELTKLATEIPEMQEVTIYSLNTKLRENNKKNSSNIIGIAFVVVMIYLRRTGNCMLSGKHLNKRRKSKSIRQLTHNKGIKLKGLNYPQKSAMSRPLSSISTNNSLKSMAQRELPQLPNTSQNHPETTLAPVLFNQDKDKYK